MANAQKKAKKLTKEQYQKLSVVTPQFRVSFPHLLVAHSASDDGKKAYSVDALFSKKTTAIDSLRQLIKNAKKFEWGSVDAAPKTFEDPIKDGDGEDYKDEETGKTREAYAKTWVVRFSTGEQYPPGVFDVDYQPVLDQNTIYGGCYAVAEINAGVWYFGSKRCGVKFYLRKVKKTDDGDRFGGTPKTAEEVFGHLENNAGNGADDENEETEESFI